PQVMAPVLFGQIMSSNKLEFEEFTASDRLVFPHGRGREPGRRTMKRYGSWVASGAALAALAANPLMARAADEKDAEKAKQEAAAEKPKEAKPTEKAGAEKPPEKAKEPEVKVSAGPDGFVIQSGNPD